MRTSQIEIFQYNELSEKSKEIAIKNLIDSYWGDGSIYNVIGDDCFLLDIKEEDKKFPIKNSSNILLGNNRGELYYTIYDSFYLNCTKSMEINDFNAFWAWLGLDKRIITKLWNSDIDLNLAGDSGYYQKTTYLELVVNKENCLTPKQESKINKAQAVFDEHICNIHKKIISQYEYMQTAEYFIENGIIDEYEFLESGKIYI